MHCETGTAKKQQLVIPELRVLVLTKRHAGSGNEISRTEVAILGADQKERGLWGREWIEAWKVLAEFCKFEFGKFKMGSTSGYNRGVWTRVFAMDSNT